MYEFAILFIATILIELERKENLCFDQEDESAMFPMPKNGFENMVAVRCSRWWNNVETITKVHAYINKDEQDKIISELKKLGYTEYRGSWYWQDVETPEYECSALCYKFEFDPIGF